MHIHFLTSSLADLLVTIVLAFIMFGIGLSLTLDNFKSLLHNPKSILIGLLSQMVLLPVIAFIIAGASGLPPVFQVGLMILAACPGGTTSGFITYLFKADVALSVSLTAINSFLSLLTITLVTNLSLNYFIAGSSIVRLDLIETALQIFYITIIPAALGVYVRFKREAFSMKIQRPVKIIMIVLLAIVFMIKFFADKSEGGTGITFHETMLLLPSTLAINVLGFLLGIFSGLIPGLGARKSFTIGIEVAMHNTTLAFLVAGNILQNQDMVKPSLIYSMFSFWTALLFGYIIRLIYRSAFRSLPEQQ